MLNRYALTVGVLLLAGASAVRAQQPLVHGIVFDDANRNGRRDSGERGIAGVSVSNQGDVVVTAEWFCLVARPRL
jgi:hypothetical protein